MFSKFIFKLLGLVLIFLQGCGSILPSHIHNPGREALALETQQVMIDYATKSPEMYSAMLLNLQTFKAEEDFLLDQLTKNYQMAFTTNAPTKSWDKYKTELNKISSEGNKFDKQIVEKAKEFLTSKNIANDNLASANEAIIKAKAKEKELRNIVNNWSQLNALLRESYASLPDVLKVMQESQNNENPLDIISNHIRKKITYIDSNGNEVEIEIRDIVKNSQHLFNDKVSLKDNLPGIDLIILNLGLDLAEVQKKKAQAELNSLIDRTKLFEDAIVIRSLTKTLIQSAEKKMENFTSSNPLRLILNDISRSNKLDPKEIELNLFDISNVLLTIRIISTSNILLARANVSLDLGLARLDHRDSIISSSSTDEAWQAVIRSGTAGLVAYHKSGWSSEDTENLIRTAQTIALAVISGGVL